MRDGTVHAAATDEVAMTLLVAFVLHANALLADLRRDRGSFWGARLPVVDALLNRARDTVTQAVEVKLAAARVRFAQFREPLVLEAIRQSAAARPLSHDQALANCPACSSTGVATGFRDAADDIWSETSGSTLDLTFDTEFTAESFACPVCGLRLGSAAEIEAAGMPLSWYDDPGRVTQLPGVRAENLVHVMRPGDTR